MGILASGSGPETLATKTWSSKPLKPAQGVRKGKPVDFAKGDSLHEWEVPFDWPDDWPEAARASFDAFHAAIFPAMWAHGRNLGDPAEIQKVLDEAGLDGRALLEATQDPAVKDALRANTDEAVARGAFGVPTFVVGDELFWGADHMLFVEKALS